jgi:hypothetical protein
MPFVSALSSVPKLLLNANRTANLPRRPASAPRLPVWDPTVCNVFEQEHITNALAQIENVYATHIYNCGGDWARLGTCMKTKKVASLSITCGYCHGGQPMSSDVNAQSLQVCLDTSNRWYLERWLVVEVVRLCGGTDLDAWAVKNFLFSIDRTSVPFQYWQLYVAELELMCAGGTRQPPPNPYLAGNFTIWDNVQGRLWPSYRQGTSIVPYGTSLIPGGFARMSWQWPC